MHPSFDGLFVDLDRSDHVRQFESQLSSIGVATFALNDISEFVELGHSLGEVLIEDDTDDHGIKAVEPGACMAGAALHTDRASQLNPPNVAIVLCSQQSESGGESIFVDGRVVYNILQRESLGAIAALTTPNSCYFGHPGYSSLTSVFNQTPDGDTFIRFRMDENAFFQSTVVRHLPLFLRLLDQQAFRIRLASMQGYALNNRWFLHGAEASPMGRRSIHRLLLNSTSIKAGFVVPQSDCA